MRRLASAALISSAVAIPTASTPDTISSSVLAAQNTPFAVQIDPKKLAGTAQDVMYVPGHTNLGAAAGFQYCYQLSFGKGGPSSWYINQYTQLPAASICSADTFPNPPNPNSNGPVYGIGTKASIPDNSVDTYFTDGSYCAAISAGRSAKLSMFEEPTATAITAEVTEPSTCSYVIRIIGPPGSIDVAKPPPSPPPGAALAPAPPVPPMGCTVFNFNKAILVRSNLGGQGGRCSEEGVAEGNCVEAQLPATPPEIYIANVGAHEAQIDLRITNYSAYYASDATLNGLKKAGRTGNSTFGVVNLLGPRGPHTKGNVPGWQTFSYVELRFEFVNAQTTEPEQLYKSYMTFLDIDAGGTTEPYGSLTAREAISFDAGVSEIHLTTKTQLKSSETLGDFWDEAGITIEQVDFFKKNQPDPEGKLMQMDGIWGSAFVYSATEKGTDGDNPTDAYNLTDVQAARSVTVELRDTSEFRARLLITSCCSTGRSFLFTGAECNDTPALVPENSILDHLHDFLMPGASETE